jgi:ParB-like chromosome segregation protein Spo0J
MEKLKHTLAHWMERPATLIPLERIETDEAMQPRSSEAVPAKYRRRLDEMSDLHIARMREDLAAFAGKETEPLLVVECGGRLLLVDGHHRLSAYRLAGRNSVPARLMPLSRPEAVMVSKLVNCDGVKLPLHPDQARDAAWQYLAHVTTYSRMPIPTGLSLRGIAATFGVSKSTVARMAAKVPEVNPKDYADVAKDPGTDWPRWRYVRGNAWRDSTADIPIEKCQRARAERVAEKFAAIMDSEGPQIARMAVEILLTQRKDEATDLLDDLLDAEAGMDADY